MKKIKWRPEPREEAVFSKAQQVRPLTEQECADINAGKLKGVYPKRMAILPTEQMLPRRVPVSGILEVIYYTNGGWRSTDARGSLGSIAHVTRYLNDYWGAGNWEYASEKEAPKE